MSESKHVYTESRASFDRFNTLLYLPLICIYAFAVQFGNLFRISGAESVPGLSTAIALILILLGPLRVIRGIVQENLILLVTLLSLWIALVSVVGGDTDENVLYAAIVFQAYVFLAAAIAQTTISEQWLVRIWAFIALGILISAGLTVVDFLGIIDVPRNNEEIISSRVGTTVVEQAGGFFPRRSAMAAIFSIGIAGVITIGLITLHWRAKLLWFLTGGLGLICLMLTHNRSALLSVILSVSAYVLIAKRLRGARRVRILTLGVLVAFGIGVVMSVYFPQHLEVYAEKLGFFYGAGEVRQTDYGRIVLFKVALTNLLSDPIGNGFTKIPLPGGIVKDSHNIVTEIVWSAGVLGVLFLIIFASLLYKRMARVKRRSVVLQHSIYLDAIFVGLTSWLLHNMAHNSLNTGLAWIFFGIALSQTRVTNRQAVRKNSTNHWNVPKPANGSVKSAR